MFYLNSITIHKTRLHGAIGAIIIHGKEETNNGDDEVFVNTLITDLQIGSINPAQVERIGNIDPNGTRKRPIKIVLSNEEERHKMLSNLTNLKGYMSYKGISITEDYTLNERKLIKEFSEQAKLKNIKEETDNSNFIWRVRGTPKNGLILKKFIKTKPQIRIPVTVTLEPTNQV